MVNLKIKLERYHGGWEWHVSGTDPITGETVSRRYRTNRVGDGLWQYVKSTTQWYGDGSAFWEWKQIRGTCQFWLNVGHKPTYDRIRYLWANDKI